MSIFLFIHMRERERERKDCQEVFNEGKQKYKRYFSAERRASVQLSPCHNSIFFCLLKLEYFTVSRVLLGKKLKLQMVPRIPLKRSGNVTFLATAMKPETFVLELHFTDSNPVWYLVNVSICQLSTGLLQHFLPMNSY